MWLQPIDGRLVSLKLPVQTLGLELLCLLLLPFSSRIGIDAPCHYLDGHLAHCDGRHGMSESGRGCDGKETTDGDGADGQGTTGQQRGIGGDLLGFFVRGATAFAQPMDDVAQGVSSHGEPPGLRPASNT